MIRRNYPTKIDVDRLISNINITPFVDVMLVLLVIFMISSSEIMPSLPIDLPTAENTEVTQEEDAPIILTLDVNGVIYVNDKSTNLENLYDEISSLSKKVKDSRIFVRGDEKCNYGLVIHLIDYVNKIGFKKVSLVTKKY